MNAIKQILSLSLLAFSFGILTTNAQSGKITIRPKINRLVEKLRKGSEVHFGYPVGFAGRPETKNKYYKLYLRLQSKATNEELVLLTSNDSKPVVIYSFSILYSRGYKNLKEIFIEHLNDTTFYWTAGGCTGIIGRVNWFMLRRLNPINGDDSKAYLTKEEYNMYCGKLKRQDESFSCN